MFQVLFSGFGSIFFILFLFLLPKFMLTMLFIIMPLGYLAFLGIAASFAFVIVLENRIIKWCASFGICLLIFGLFSTLAIPFVERDNHTPIWIAAFCAGFFTLIGIIAAFAFIIDKLAQRKKRKKKHKLKIP